MDGPKLKKVLLLLFVGLFIFSINTATAQEIYTSEEVEGIEEEPGVVGQEVSRQEIIDRQLESLDLDELEREVARIRSSGEEILPEFKLRDLIGDMLTGELDLKQREIIYALFSRLAREVAENFAIMGQLLLLGLLGAVLKILSDSFASRSVARTANMIIFLLMGVLLLNSFYTAARVAREAIEAMVMFMQALLPVLLSLLVGMGGLTSASIFHPLTYLIITTLSTLIKNIVLPLVLLSFILTVVDNIGDDFNISRLASLFKEFSLSFLTISLSLFIGSSFLQGGVAAVSDSLTLRTARHLSGKFIPVVGGVFSGALEVIVGCSLLIKNAVNLLGILGIISIIALPVIKIAAMVLIYRAVAALLQPVAEKRVVNIVNAAGSTLMIILGILIAVAIMFFLVVAIIAGTANLTVMMR